MKAESGHKGEKGREGERNSQCEGENAPPSLISGYFNIFNEKLENPTQSCRICLRQVALNFILLKVFNFFTSALIFIAVFAWRLCGGGKSEIQPCTYVVVWEAPEPLDWVPSGGRSFLLRLLSSHLLSYFVPGLCHASGSETGRLEWVELDFGELSILSGRYHLTVLLLSCETPLRVPKETRNLDSLVRSSDFENAVTNGSFLAAAVQGWHFQTSGFQQLLNTLLLRFIYIPSFLWPFPLILSCHNWVVPILGSVFEKCFFAHCLLVPKQLSTSWST